MMPFSSTSCSKLTLLSLDFFARKMSPGELNSPSKALGLMKKSSHASLWRVGTGLKLMNVLFHTTKVLTIVPPPSLPGASHLEPRHRTADRDTYPASPSSAQAASPPLCRHNALKTSLTHAVLDSGTLIRVKAPKTNNCVQFLEFIISLIWVLCPSFGLC